MRTSNKLLLSALIIFVIGLGIYNSALKAEYLAGSYKNPYKDFNALNFKDFDEIEVNAASQMDVTITNGDNNVRVSKSAAKQIKVTQQGRKLIIDLVFSDHKFREWSNYIDISCPKLVAVKTRSFYMDQDKRITDNTNDKGNFNYHHVTIKGFKLDSLSLEQDNANEIQLSDNHIGLLNVLTGITASATPQLTIQKGNTIEKANLQMMQRSQLDIDNVYIPQLKYHFSDSARVTLSGTALKSLNK